MSSYITVVPASTKAGKESVRALLNSEEKPLVKAVYRDIQKVPKEFLEHKNFVPIQGDIALGSGLDFGDSRAVLYIAPPTFDGRDQGDHATLSANYIKQALAASTTVQKLVLQSCMGSENDHGIGALKINHITDEILKPVAREVVIVKPSWYYENWADSLKTMNSADRKLETVFSPADLAIPMVSVKDVGSYCAEELLKKSSNPGIHAVELSGPQRYSSLDVKQAIEEILGVQGDLIVIPKDKLETYFGTHLPKEYAPEFAEMITSMLPGGVIAETHLVDKEEDVRCSTTLSDGLREILQTV